MSKSLSIDYPIFNYKNESLILKSGQRFSMNELKSRLHQMDVDDVININSKSQMENLYDSIIKDDRNKIKILDRLRKDTLNYSKMTGINFNQRRRLPEEDAYTQESNEKSKLINLQMRRYNEPYEQNNNNTNNNYNYRKQEIKLRKNNKNIRNPFREEINNNINDNNLKEQNEDTYYQEYNNNKNNNNYNNNNIEYSRKYQNEESGYSDINNTNNYNNNYNNNNAYYNNNNNNQMYTNEPREKYNKNTPSFPYQQKNEDNDNNDYYMNNKLNVKDNNISTNKIDNIRKKSLDEESSFSILSSIKSAKRVCFYSSIAFIVICLALLLYYLFNKFSDAILAFFNQTLEVLSNPGNIFSNILDFLSNYWYFIPIILVIGLIAFVVIRKRRIKNLCKEIIKKIEEDLSEKNDDEIRCISEDDIYRKYLQNRGISFEDFNKYYLPILQKMRRINKKLRISCENIGGKNVRFWEYNS